MTTLALAYLGPMLLAAALVARYAGRRPLSRRARLGAALAAAAFVMLPVGDLNVAEYVRAVAGDLSMITQAMLAAFVIGFVDNRRLLDQRQVCAVMAAALAGALFLYPAALGLVSMDPYALGFASIHFAAALAAFTVLAWYLSLHWLAACLLLAVSARLLGALESRNLWDYLLDPLLALYAAYWLCRMAMRRAAAAPLNAIKNRT